MIWVKDFELIGGDPEGGAEVFLTDGTFECCCFAWLYYGKIGDFYVKNEPINFLYHDLAIRSDVEQPILTHLGNWEHFIVGQLIGRERNMVQVGEFCFDVDGVPGDIQEGEYIEFRAYRPDIH